MSIFVKWLNDNTIQLEVEINDTIGLIKEKINDIEGIPPNVQKLYFQTYLLEDFNTLEYYSISNGSTLHLLLNLRGGGVGAESPSETIGLLENDIEKVKTYIKPGKLTSRYIKNTNSSRVYQQVGGTCYAYAASSAYINTIMRIYRSKEPHLMNVPNGGNPLLSIQKLEKHFHYGVCCRNETKCCLRRIDWKPKWGNG